MAIPAYMWMKDERGELIPSTVIIKEREQSAEIVEFHHKIRIPSDPDTGKLTGTRKHDPLIIVKEFCSASPILYKACCDGKTFEDVIISWYRINAAGIEEEYFRHTLEKVKVVAIEPMVQNVKLKEKEQYGHLERVQFRYQTIQWQYLDGNIMTYDSWNEKT